MRTVIIFLTIFNSAIAMSQPLTFDSAVRRLYFDVDIRKVSGSLVDTFMKLGHFKYTDNGVRQWNLNIAMEMGTDEESWSSRHVFTFTESPIPGLKIKSGQITVTIGETSKIKKLLGLEWQVDFANKKDADIFFGRLKKIFEPLSTKQKNEFDKDVGEIAQYSTRKAGENGIKDISFIVGKSPRTKNYEVSFSLGNEFMRE